MILRSLSPDKGWIWALSLLMIALGAGCSTTSVNWDNRVGAYSWEDALAELGDPDRVADLAGGVKAAEWIKSRGTGMPSANPPKPYTRAETIEAYQTYGTQAPDKVLRLTFTPDGKLLDWDRNY